MNALHLVSEFNRSAAELPSRLGHDGGVSTGAASAQKGWESGDEEAGMVRGVTERNTGGLNDFSH